jgi:hypothetical protein
MECWIFFLLDNNQILTIYNARLGLQMEASHIWSYILIGSRQIRDSSHST